MNGGWVGGGLFEIETRFVIASDYQKSLSLVSSVIKTMQISLKNEQIF